MDRNEVLLPALQVLRAGPTSVSTVSRYLGQVPWSSILRYVRYDAGAGVVELTAHGRECLEFWESHLPARPLPWSTVMLAANACARARTGARLAELGRAAVWACEQLGCVRDGLLTPVGVLFAQARTLAGSSRISPETFYARFWLTLLDRHGPLPLTMLADVAGCPETAVVGAMHWLGCVQLVEVYGAAELRRASISDIGRWWLTEWDVLVIPASESAPLAGVAA